MDKKILDTSGLVTTTVLNTKVGQVENKIPDTIGLLTSIVLNTKISEVENTIPDNSMYITTQEFNELMGKNLESRLRQADLVNKTDFDDKLTSFNIQITSNKIKHLEVQKN